MATDNRQALGPTSRDEAQQPNAIEDLLNAVSAGSLAEVKRVVNQKANVNAECNNVKDSKYSQQESPLLIALINGNVEIAEYLLESKADLLAPANLPFHLTNKSPFACAGSIIHDSKRHADSNKSNKVKTAKVILEAAKKIDLSRLKQLDQEFYSKIFEALNDSNLEFYPYCWSSFTSPSTPPSEGLQPAKLKGTHSFFTSTADLPHGPASASLLSADPDSSSSSRFPSAPVSPPRQDRRDEEGDFEMTDAPSSSSSSSSKGR